MCFVSLERSSPSSFAPHLNLGHAGHASYEDDVVDLRLGDVGVLEAVLARVDGAADEGIDEGLELGAGDLQGGEGVCVCVGVRMVRMIMI